MSLTTPEELMDYAFGDTWKTKPTANHKIILTLSPDKAIAFVKYVQHNAIKACADSVQNYHHKIPSADTEPRIVTFGAAAEIRKLKGEK